jgi:hypothetical protein
MLNLSKLRIADSVNFLLRGPICDPRFVAIRGEDIKNVLEVFRRGCSVLPF